MASLISHYERRSRVVDPALKESAFHEHFNRLARSCFYGAANACSGHLPTVDPHSDVVDASIPRLPSSVWRTILMRTVLGAVEELPCGKQALGRGSKAAKETMLPTSGSCGRILYYAP